MACAIPRLASPAVAKEAGWSAGALRHYRLEPIETGTRFTQINEFEWKNLPRALHATFARGVRRDIRRQLRALKQHLER